MGLDAGRISLLTSIAWRDEPGMHVTRAGGSILYNSQGHRLHPPAT
jgi:hypothetical protein